MKSLIKCLILLLLISSCSDDLETIPPVTLVEEESTPPPTDSTITNPFVEFFNPSLVSDNYVLINDAGANEVYLIDKQGNTIHEWPLGDERLGNDAFLLPNGKLLTMLEVADPKIQIGGFGGKIQLLDKNASVDWSFEYASEDYILHHDAEMLPNGNIITQIWERKKLEDALNAGSNLETEVFPDGIIEIDPSTDTIVWEWHAWDHLVQDFDATKENYGSVAENPQLIDLNYVTPLDGDIMHANGLAYDEVNDLIFLSVNFFSEIWVIDHSTTTNEAASHDGGNYGKGGDLVYRFGNPSAYKNPMGKRLFHNNHFPNLLTGEDLGNLLVFTNGDELERSTVFELKLPSTFELLPNFDNEPETLWSFTSPDLFSAKVSGAVRLPNGNTLITEGDFGFWEVTEEKELVWQFEKTGFYWRGYHFNKDGEAILNLNLDL